MSQPDENVNRLPKPGWWRCGLSAEKFFDRLEHFGVVDYRRDEVEFTHDVYLGSEYLGEAGCLERPFDAITIGFFAMLGREPRYRIIPETYVLDARNSPPS